MGFWSQIWKSRAERWTFERVDPSRAPADGAQVTVRPNTSYITVWLETAQVVDVRKGLTKFYGVVHSHMSLPELSGQVAHFNVVNTPNALKSVDPKNLDRVVQLQRLILGPVPFRAGPLEFEIGLFSVEEANLAQPFIGLLEEISGLAGVSFLSAALPYAKPLMKGIEFITGGGGNESVLEIGVAGQTNEITTGYAFVARVPKGDLDSASLRIDASDKTLLTGAGPFKNFPYLVLRVAASSQRDDWFMIPEVSSAYNSLRQDVRSGDAKRIDEGLAVFRRTTLTSADLLPQDAARVVELVTQETKPAAPSGTLAEKGKAVGKLPDLKDLPLYSGGRQSN